MAMVCRRVPTLDTIPGCSHADGFADAKSPSTLVAHEVSLDALACVAGESR